MVFFIELFIYWTEFWLAETICNRLLFGGNDLESEFSSDSHWNLCNIDVTKPGVHST